MLQDRWQCQTEQNINRFWNLVGDTIGLSLVELDLHALIDTLPNLVTIAFNGGTAAKIGIHALGERGSPYSLLRLPSSSPAYAAVPYTEKLAAWQPLRQAN